MKTIAAVFLVLLLFHSFVQETLPGRSSYSFKLGVLDCDNIERLKGCRHEIGHKMDDDLGMPSQSAEFAIATKAEVLVMMTTAQPNDIAMLIYLYPDPDLRELYPAIYSYVEGDISKLPESLQGFYSDDPTYLNLYDCLTDAMINVCGRSFSYLKGQQ